jgi:hypothetical protein
MAYIFMNSKLTKLIGVILILIISWMLIFEKQKDYYEIEEIRIELIALENNEIVKLNKKNINNIYDKTGVSIKFDKKFVSGKNSRRMLFGGSMEKGLKGIKNKLYPISIKINDKPSGNKLKAFNFQFKSNADLGDDLFNLYKDEVNFDKFIEDLVNNKSYTRGKSFDDYEIFFWFENIEKPIITSNKIIVNYTDKKTLIKKSLKNFYSIVFSPANGNVQN